jgi:hypothetical protein
MQKTPRGPYYTQAPEWYAARRERIVQARREGQTLTAIGDTWDITGQRVRQIIIQALRRRSMGVNFNCSICNRPASIGEAVIEVDSGNRAVWDWLERTPQIASGPALRVTTLSDVPDWPVVEWEWNHRTCAEASDKGREYSFDASRMSNSAEALGWTLHLQGKNWMAATNWKEFVEGLGFSSDG